MKPKPWRLHLGGVIRQNTEGLFQIDCSCGAASGYWLEQAPAWHWWRAHWYEFVGRKYSKSSENPLEAIVAIVKGGNEQETPA